MSGYDSPRDEIFDDPFNTHIFDSIENIQNTIGLTQDALEKHQFLSQSYHQHTNHLRSQESTHSSNTDSDGSDDSSTDGDGQSFLDTSASTAPLKRSRLIPLDDTTSLAPGYSPRTNTAHPIFSLSLSEQQSLQDQLQILSTEERVQLRAPIHSMHDHSEIDDIDEDDGIDFHDFGKEDDNDGQLLSQSDQFRIRLTQVQWERTNSSYLSLNHGSEQQQFDKTPQDIELEKHQREIDSISLSQIFHPSSQSAFEALPLKLAKLTNSNNSKTIETISKFDSTIKNYDAKYHLHNMIINQDQHSGSQLSEIIAKNRQPHPSHAIPQPQIPQLTALNTEHLQSHPYNSENTLSSQNVHNIIDNPTNCTENPCFEPLLIPPPKTCHGLPSTSTAQPNANLLKNDQDMAVPGHIQQSIDNIFSPHSSTTYNQNEFEKIVNHGFSSTVEFATAIFKENYYSDFLLYNLNILNRITTTAALHPKRLLPFFHSLLLYQSIPTPIPLKYMLKDMWLKYNKSRYNLASINSTLQFCPLPGLEQPSIELMSTLINNIQAGSNSHVLLLGSKFNKPLLIIATCLAHILYQHKPLDHTSSFGPRSTVPQITQNTSGINPTQHTYNNTPKTQLNSIILHVDGGLSINDNDSIYTLCVQLAEQLNIPCTLVKGHSTFFECAEFFTIVMKSLYHFDKNVDLRVIHAHNHENSAKHTLSSTKTGVLNGEKSSTDATGLWGQFTDVSTSNLGHLSSSSSTTITSNTTLSLPNEETQTQYQQVPIFIIIDSFEYFARSGISINNNGGNWDGTATHGVNRQSFLYFLGDIAQTNQAWLHIIGISAIPNCLDFLEKRVKSRFPMHIINSNNPTQQYPVDLLKNTSVTGQKMANSAGIELFDDMEIHKHRVAGILYQYLALPCESIDMSQYYLHKYQTEFRELLQKNFKNNEITENSKEGNQEISSTLSQIINSPGKDFKNDGYYDGDIELHEDMLIVPQYWSHIDSVKKRYLLHLPHWTSVFYYNSSLFATLMSNTIMEDVITPIIYNGMQFNDMLLFVQKIVHNLMIFPTILNPLQVPVPQYYYQYYNAYKDAKYAYLCSLLKKEQLNSCQSLNESGTMSDGPDNTIENVPLSAIVAPSKHQLMNSRGFDFGTDYQPLLSTTNHIRGGSAKTFDDANTINGKKRPRKSTTDKIALGAATQNFIHEPSQFSEGLPFSQPCQVHIEYPINNINLNSQTLQHAPSQGLIPLPTIIPTIQKPSQNSSYPKETVKKSAKRRVKKNNIGLLSQLPLYKFFTTYRKTRYIASVLVNPWDILTAYYYVTDQINTSVDYKTVYMQCKALLCYKPYTFNTRSSIFNNLPSADKEYYIDLLKTLFFDNILQKVIDTGRGGYANMVPMLSTTHHGKMTTASTTRHLNTKKYTNTIGDKKHGFFFTNADITTTTDQSIEGDITDMNLVIDYGMSSKLVRFWQSNLSTSEYLYYVDSVTGQGGIPTILHPKILLTLLGNIHRIKINYLSHFYFKPQFSGQVDKSSFSLNSLLPLSYLKHLNNIPYFYNLTPQYTQKHQILLNIVEFLQNIQNNNQKSDNTTVTSADTFKQSLLVLYRKHQEYHNFTSYSLFDHYLSFFTATILIENTVHHQTSIQAKLSVEDDEFYNTHNGDDITIETDIMGDIADFDSILMNDGNNKRYEARFSDNSIKTPHNTQFDSGYTLFMRVVSNNNAITNTQYIGDIIYPDYRTHSNVIETAGTIVNSVKSKNIEHFKDLPDVINLTANFEQQRITNSVLTDVNTHRYDSFDSKTAFFGTLGFGSDGEVLKNSQLQKNNENDRAIKKIKGNNAPISTPIAQKIQQPSYMYQYNTFINTSVTSLHNPLYYTTVQYLIKSLATIHPHGLGLIAAALRCEQHKNMSSYTYNTLYNEHIYYLYQWFTLKYNSDTGNMDHNNDDVFFNEFYMSYNDGLTSILITLFEHHFFVFPIEYFINTSDIIELNIDSLLTSSGTDNFFGDNNDVKHNLLKFYSEESNELDQIREDDEEEDPQMKTGRRRGRPAKKHPEVDLISNETMNNPNRKSKEYIVPNHILSKYPQFSSLFLKLITIPPTSSDTDEKQTGLLQNIKFQCTINYNIFKQFIQWFKAYLYNYNLSSYSNTNNALNNQLLLLSQSIPLWVFDFFEL